jgi:hypothetical protein
MERGARVVSGTRGRQDPPILFASATDVPLRTIPIADQATKLVLDFGRGSREQSQGGKSPSGQAAREDNVHSLAERRRQI